MTTDKQIAHAAKKIADQTSWPYLAEQKKFLIDLRGNPFQSNQNKGFLDGLINWIDYIQDTFVDEMHLVKKDDAFPTEDTA